MEIKRPAILDTEPHTINMGVTNKGAMNRAPTPQFGAKPACADTPSPTPNPHRRSIRLPGYDYSQPGAYFITICTHGQICHFGEVVDATIQANSVGEVAIAQWHALPERFPNIRLDAFVCMPNHIHAIVVIQSGATHSGAMNSGAMNCAPTKSADTIGNVVRVFKAISSRVIRRELCATFAWQRNYYEHIIRNEPDLARIREYIANNPLQWQLHVGAQFIAPDSQFIAPDSQFTAPDLQFIAPDSGEK